MPIAAAEQRMRGYGAAVYYAPLDVTAQGGRWSSVLPLLLTGARIILSDVDVVFLRDPRPYLRALETEHPRLDFSVSTDAQSVTDGRRLHSTGARGDLDVEAFGSCHASMNIGIMHFPPGARNGSLRAIREAIAHLRLPGNARRVDQGPINYRWKFGFGSWRWPRQLHRVAGRLCGLVDGNVVAGILPLAQFGNTLTHAVLQLPQALSVSPIALHATWMRTQHADYKIWRLREEGLWHEAPSWYRGRFLSYTPQVPSHALARNFTLTPRAGGGGGGLPASHLALMRLQLAQLRNGLFLARLLQRSLILPTMHCGCELGFFPRHIAPGCRARDHRTLRLPYACAIDHVLNPMAIATSPYALRERSFVEHAHSSAAVRQDVTTVVVGGDAAGVAAATTTARARRRRRDAVIRLPDTPLASTVVAALGPLTSTRLHVEDVSRAFGGFDGDNASALTRMYHADAQRLLDSWCCTSEAPFRERTAGLVPYLLPPLPGQHAWRGEPTLRWADRALRALVETHST